MVRLRHWHYDGSGCKYVCQDDKCKLPHLSVLAINYDQKESPMDIKRCKNCKMKSKLAFTLLLALCLLTIPFVFGITTYVIRYLIASPFQESDLVIYLSWVFGGFFGVLLTGIYIIGVPLVLSWIVRNFVRDL